MSDGEPVSRVEPPMLLFGVRGRDETRYSDVWRIVSVPDEPNVFVTPLKQGKSVHVSYHPGRKWFFSIRMPGRKPTPPKPITGHRVSPNYVHLLQVEVPPEGLYRDPYTLEEVTWIDPPAHRGEGTFFDLYLEVRGEPGDYWPAKDRGSMFVGRLPIPDGSTIALIASHGAPREWPRSTLIPEVAEFMRSRPDKKLAEFMYREAETGVLLLTIRDLSGIALGAA